MKQVTGWWFTTKDRVLPHGDGRKVKLGVTHEVKGEIRPCFNGLHLSKKPLDALKYAPGPIVYKVRGHGVVIPHGNPIDKHACSKRTYLEGGYDATETLRLFARLCALDVIHLWDAPEVVVRYLQTGDDKLRAAAYAAARTAVRTAVDAAERAAADAAARTAAERPAWDAAERAAADAAARAAWGAADAAKKKQNKRLKKLLNDLIKNYPLRKY